MLVKNPTQIFIYNISSKLSTSYFKSNINNLHKKVHTLKVQSKLNYNISFMLSVEEGSSKNCQRLV